MAFYTYFSGTATVKTEEDAEQVCAFLERSRLFDPYVDYSKEASGFIVECRGGLDENQFDINEFNKLYRQITPYLKHFSLDFNNEDERWRHQYENGEWSSAEGEIVYGDKKTFSVGLEKIEKIQSIIDEIKAARQENNKEYGVYGENNPDNLYLYDTLEILERLKKKYSEDVVLTDKLFDDIDNEYPGIQFDNTYNFGANVTNDIMWAEFKDNGNFGIGGHDMVMLAFHLQGDVRANYSDALILDMGKGQYRNFRDYVGRKLDAAQSQEKSIEVDGEIYGVVLDPFMASCVYDSRGGYVGQCNACEKELLVEEIKELVREKEADIEK